MSKHPVEKIKHAVPLNEELSLHKKGWVIQRIGWVCMYAFILLALLGMFGEGPISKKRMQAANITLHFDRFTRYEHETELKLESDSEHIAQISLPQTYVLQFEVSKIVPEPIRQIASKGYINYLFGGSENHHIIFYLRPKAYGTIKASIVGNHHAIAFNQTIFP